MCPSDATESVVNVEMNKEVNSRPRVHYDPSVIIHNGDVSGTTVNFCRAGKLEDVIGNISTDNGCLCECCFFHRHSVTVEINRTEPEDFTVCVNRCVEGKSIINV